MEQNQLTLSQLNFLIKDTLEGNFMEDIWLIAEIAEIRNASSGHCYLELVEKKDQKTIARIRANIWSFNYQRISSQFFKATGDTIKAGMKILCLASVGFHEVFGLSLIIKNIDENYSLGELERQKKEILARLIKERLTTLNKAKEFPMLPKKVALISSSSAAGYEDFMNQIENNPNKYNFNITFFNALMQGDGLGVSIIAQLNEIIKQINKFDIVVILRGGGAAMDLQGFNDYELCKAIAQFPIPVISGIGHERDHTLVDEVTHTKVKTPTAAAEFLIGKFEEIDAYIQGQQEALVYVTKELVNKYKRRNQKVGLNIIQLSKAFQKQKINDIQSSKNKFINASKRQLKKHQQLINYFPRNIKTNLQNYAKTEQKKHLDIIKMMSVSKKNLLQKKQLSLVNKKQIVDLTNPINVLKRGYSIIKNNEGGYIKSALEFDKQTKMEVIFKDGERSFEITNNTKNKKK